MGSSHRRDRRHVPRAFWTDLGSVLSTITQQHLKARKTTRGQHMETHRLDEHVTVINDHLEVPGLGFLPVNAFVLHASEPVVVDTGVSLPDRDFVAALSTVIDPAEVRWIWLSHPDRDHTGGLFELLAAAPHARLVTTFLG